MKRVLVVTIPEKGHFHPLVAPARALRRRGFEVAFAAARDVSVELSALGFDRFFAPAGAGRPSSELRGEALAKTIREPDALAGWIRRLLVEFPGQSVSAFREIIREFRPDVVAMDTMAYEGAIAATLEGVPWVGWATSLNPVLPDEMRSTLLDTIAMLAPERDALFRNFGIAARFRCSDVLSRHGTAVFSTEALVGSPRAEVALVGSSLVEQNQDAGSMLDFVHGRPLVYVSFGSQAWHQPERYERLMAAVRGLDVAMLIAMGDLATLLGSRAPENVRCVAQAPQLAVLSRARVAVTHGGANSVMEGLSFGVPLLVSPICNDQPHNAEFVKRAKAGRYVDLETTSGDSLRAEIVAMLGDCGERRGAQVIAQSYRSRDGGEGAAQLAARLVS